MNTLITAPSNSCPSTKEYKMNPISRKLGTPFIKRPPQAPKLGPNDPLVHYRILKLDNNVATVCADMTRLVNEQLIVRDTDISSLGLNGVRVGDIIGFRNSDVDFSKPLITFRKSQQHQHPEQLVASDEK